MDYHNLTPFPSLSFASLDKNDRLDHVIVLRSTYAIQSDGSLLALGEQGPLVTEDVYHGEPNGSSIQQESDLAPFKPKCDVIVSGTAYAPGGLRARSFGAGITIRDKENVLVRKRIVITGPRYWRKRLL